MNLLYTEDLFPALTGLEVWKRDGDKSWIKYSWDRCSEGEWQGSLWEWRGTSVSRGRGPVREGITEETTFKRTSEWRREEVSKARWMKKHPKQRYLVVFKFFIFLFFYFYFLPTVFFLYFCKWNFTLSYNVWVLVDERIATRVEVGMTCSLQVFTTCPLVRDPSLAPWKLRTQSKNHGASPPPAPFYKWGDNLPILRDLSQSCLSVTEDPRHNSNADHVNGFCRNTSPPARVSLLVVLGATEVASSENERQSTDPSTI